MNQLIGQNIIRLKSTASSNNYAICKINDNEPVEGTVFLTYEQTDGKGLLKNKWESEAGKNLNFSIFIKPSFLSVKRQYMLAKVVCLGIESSLSKILDDLKIKWPNDIYSGNKKICGILIENSIMEGVFINSVIGIGINVNQMVFRSDAPNPVSIKQITKKDYDIDRLLEKLLVAIDRYYNMLKDGAFAEIDSEFTSKLYQLDELKWYEDKAHYFKGTITGVNGLGQLLIQEDNGIFHAYNFKELVFR